jgi:hypothetical protein
MQISHPSLDLSLVPVLLDIKAGSKLQGISLNIMKALYLLSKLIEIPQCEAF